MAGKASNGWKVLEVRLKGGDCPADRFTVANVRDAIEDYKRKYRLSPMREFREFDVAEIRAKETVAAKEG